MYGSRGCTARVALERYVSTAVFWQIDQQSENLMMVLLCLLLRSQCHSQATSSYCRKNSRIESEHAAATVWLCAAAMVRSPIQISPMGRLEVLFLKRGWYAQV
eukprot:SAG25_NODE_5333_length_671_cov_1.138112_1_plen_102_part_10